MMQQSYDATIGNLMFLAQLVVLQSFKLSEPEPQSPMADLSRPWRPSLVRREVGPTWPRQAWQNQICKRVFQQRRGVFSV